MVSRLRARANDELSRLLGHETTEGEWVLTTPGSQYPDPGERRRALAEEFVIELNEPKVRDAAEGEHPAEAEDASLMKTPEGEHDYENVDADEPEGLFGDSSWDDMDIGVV